MADTYVTLVSQAVGNERDGFSFAANWDHKQFDTKAKAVANGFRWVDCDDFNVGVVRKGRLVEVWWMDKLIDETDDNLREMAAQVGLKGPEVVDV